MHTLSVLTFIGAAVAGFFGTEAARRIALRFGFCAKPNPIVPQHKAPVAYMGGVGIALGLLATLPLIGFSAEVEAMLIPGAAFLVLGVVDDLAALKPFPKLAMQLVVAVVAVVLGIGVELTSNTFVDGAISVLWILILVNAVNFTDVCDGLVGVLAVVAFGALAIFHGETQGVSLALAGASLGFFLLNAPPAKIFMGDAGSHVIGYFIAALTMNGFSRSAPPSWVSTWVVASPFLLELFLITSERVRKGLPLWKGSPDHLSLRLQHAGWSKWRVDLACCSVFAAVCGLVASSMQGKMAVQVAAAVTVTVWVCAFLALRRLPAPSLE